MSAALDTLVTSARARGLTSAPSDRTAETARPEGADVRHSAQPDGYLRARPDGTFTKVVYGIEQPHEVPSSQVAELGHLLALRDTVRALLDTEAACAEDTAELSALRTELGHRYDTCLAADGPLNRFALRRTGRTDPATGEPVMARIRPPQGGFSGDPFAPLVYALEQFDPVGQRAAKAAIFRERVIAPRAPRLGADTAADALAICLDTRGEVRLGEIARLLGATEDDAREQLGTLVGKPFHDHFGFQRPQGHPFLRSTSTLLIPWSDHCRRSELRTRPWAKRVVATVLVDDPSGFTISG